MWRRSYMYLYNLETKTCTFLLNHTMARTFSFGLVSSFSQMSKPATCAPTSTIVHSTLVGRRSFSDLGVDRVHSSSQNIRLIAYTPAGQNFIDNYLYGYTEIPSQCADEVMTDAGFAGLSVA